MTTTQLKIEGMHCDMCVQHVTRALHEVPGVTTSKVDLQSSLASVQHEGADVQKMIEVIESEGYTASAQS
jgi:copper chaperone CopZ